MRNPEWENKFEKHMDLYENGEIDAVDFQIDLHKVIPIIFSSEFINLGKNTRYQDINRELPNSFTGETYYDRVDTMYDEIEKRKQNRKIEKRDNILDGLAK